jgi:hypothetical protein
VSVGFKASRVAVDCLMEAYAQVVPTARRQVQAGALRRRSSGGQERHRTGGQQG